MKVVFSRKGVDSAAGKCASALVDGRPISFPIPTREPSPTSYGMLRSPVQELAHDLSNGRLSGDAPCHLDPDIDPSALAERPPGWRGALGQVSSSLSHLQNQSVGPGDLFLFWGLYREAKRVRGAWRYGGPRIHAAFGWLAIDSVHEIGNDPAPLLDVHPWLRQHPHVREGWRGSNAVYIAAQSFELAGRQFPGSGVFHRAHRLTAPDSPRPSLWAVPQWLDMVTGGVGMTYHDRHRWLGNERLQTAARGQEFVADIGERDDARIWIADLLEAHR